MPDTEDTSSDEYGRYVRKVDHLVTTMASFAETVLGLWPTDEPVATLFAEHVTGMLTELVYGEVAGARRKVDLIHDDLWHYFDPEFRYHPSTTEDR